MSIPVGDTENFDGGHVVSADATDSRGADDVSDAVHDCRDIGELSKGGVNELIVSKAQRRRYNRSW